MNDPPPGITWDHVRRAIAMVSGEDGTEFGAPKAACDAAMKWCDFLEGLGARVPRVLPDNDSLCLTWELPAGKHYLIIDSDESASLFDLEERLRILAALADQPQDSGDKLTS